MRWPLAKFSKGRPRSRSLVIDRNARSLRPTARGPFTINRATPLYHMRTEDTLVGEYAPLGWPQQPIRSSMQPWDLRPGKKPAAQAARRVAHAPAHVPRSRAVDSKSNDDMKRVTPSATGTPSATPRTARAVRIAVRITRRGPAPSADRMARSRRRGRPSARNDCKLRHDQQERRHPERRHQESPGAAPACEPAMI